MYLGSFVFLSQSTYEPGRDAPRGARGRGDVPANGVGAPGGALGDTRSEPGRAEGTTCAHVSVLRNS